MIFQNDTANVTFILLQVSVLTQFPCSVSNLLVVFLFSIVSEGTFWQVPSNPEAIVLSVLHISKDMLGMLFLILQNCGASCCQFSVWWARTYYLLASVPLKVNWPVSQKSFPTLPSSIEKADIVLDYIAKIFSFEITQVKQSLLFLSSHLKINFRAKPASHSLLQWGGTTILRPGGS